MVFRNNLDRFILEENKVFYVVDKTILIEKTIYKVANGTITCITCILKCFTVKSFFFGFNLQPFKEEVISCIKGTQLGFKTVGEHTYLIECKKVWNILFVILQILVVCFLNLNNTVFEFNEHKGQTVYKDNDIRSSVIRLALYPHLRYSSKGIIGRSIKIDELYKIKVFLAILANGDFNTVAKLVI